MTIYPVRRQNDGAVWLNEADVEFFPVARANFFSVANDGPLIPDARLLSILVIAVALSHSLGNFSLS